MKAEIPVLTVIYPFINPQIIPIPKPINIAGKTDISYTSINPVKEIATNPPIAPTERFIWPIAIIII